jgi:hypothetical protein
MRRRKLLVVLAGLAVVVAAVVVVLWPRANCVTLTNYSSIQQGMTFPEVEAILGGPPGDYRTSPTQFEFGDPSFRHRRSLLPGTGAREEHWEGDTVALMVRFGDDGTVRCLCPIPTARRAGGRFDAICWRLKRQWHRWFRE